MNACLCGLSMTRKCENPLQKRCFFVSIKIFTLFLDESAEETLS